MSNIPERSKGYKEGLQNFINYISKDYNTKELSIVEIGVWTGAGSEIFAKSFKEVHCIDMWKPIKTDSLTIRFNVKEATLLRVMPVYSCSR